MTIIFSIIWTHIHTFHEEKNPFKIKGVSSGDVSVNRYALVHTKELSDSLFILIIKIILKQ